LIDKDSFTYNLYQYPAAAGGQPLRVIRNEPWMLGIALISATGLYSLFTNRRN
jgi:anthranilate/para-aminobenzoate synthase component II